VILGVIEMSNIYRLSVRTSAEEFQLFKFGTYVYFDHVPDFQTAMKAMCEHLRAARIPALNDDILMSLDDKDISLVKQSFLDKKYDFCKEVMRVLKESGVPNLNGCQRSNTMVLGDGGATTIETVEVWTRE
jgi:hypothetical protein